MDVSELLKKPYARLVLPDTDGTFSAEIVEFPGCIAVGGTAAEALSNLDEVAADWIAAELEQGHEIPEPMDTAGFSGKLVLRMSKGLHRRAALAAEREGVSLNSFIVTCVAETVGERAKAQTVTFQPQVQAIAHMILQIGVPTIAPPRTQQIQMTGPGQSFQMTGISAGGAVIPFRGSTKVLAHA